MKVCIVWIFAVASMLFAAENTWSQGPEKLERVDDAKTAKALGDLSGDTTPNPLASSDLDPFMGVYKGVYTRGGKTHPAEARVAPRGQGKYFLSVLSANPEDATESIRIEMRKGGKALSAGTVEGEPEGRGISFEGEGLGTNWHGRLIDGSLEIEAEKSEMGRFSLEIIDPKSPTAGLEPPRDAIVLLPLASDGRPSLEEWSNKSWRRRADGSMEVGKGNTKTKREFGDVRIHLEFICPFQPENSGQRRANSGVYIQNRYELQVLDSFGLKPKSNQCAGIYQLAVPTTEAEFPPGTWQTYDIVFRAPRLSEDGRLEKPAMIEQAKLNGVVVHENVELPRPTTAAGATGHAEEGPLMLQDHGHPVRYRNIWIQTLD